MGILCTYIKGVKYIIYYTYIRTYIKWSTMSIPEALHYYFDCSLSTMRNVVCFLLFFFLFSSTRVYQWTKQLAPSAVMFASKFVKPCQNCVSQNGSTNNEIMQCSTSNALFLDIIYDNFYSFILRSFNFVYSLKFCVKIYSKLMMVFFFT